MNEITTELKIYSQRLIEYSIIFNKEHLTIIKPKRKKREKKIAIYSNLKWTENSGDNDLINMMHDELNCQVDRDHLPIAFAKIWKAWKHDELKKQDIDKKLDELVRWIKESKKEEFAVHYCEADRTNILERIDIFMETITSRLLPTFDNIKKESEEVENQSFENLSKGVYPDEDPSDAYVQSYGEGCRHYAIQNEMKQELLNHYASVLFHLFEKDCNEMKLSYKGNFKCVEVYLVNISNNNGSNFEKINTELRLIANVIKHGKGDSYNKLKNIRKDLFKNKSWIIGTSEIGISLDELQEYADAMKGFWEEFFDIKLALK